MQQHALHRDKVDWSLIRREAGKRCTGAGTVEATYPAIKWALAALGDGHSFFSPPHRGARAIEAGDYENEAQPPSGYVRADGIPILSVPAFRGSPKLVSQYAQMMCSLIADFARQRAPGWIVDLADNTGGNMMPMLAGLGPLLGVGTIGAFEFANHSQTPWQYDETGRLWLDHECVLRTSCTVDPVQQLSPVAVVIGPRTASSGEAVVIAFSGRSRSRSFGLPTRGVSTSNESFDLVDGASLAITTARFADRTGRVFGGAVYPDEPVSIPGPTTYDLAAHWVLSNA
ncbi:MAG: S41 family peptidase [Pseudomonadota bacterium]